MVLHAPPEPLAHFPVQGDERCSIAPGATLCHQGEGQLAGLPLDAEQIVLVYCVGFDLQPCRRTATAIDAVRAALEREAKALARR